MHDDVSAGVAPAIGRGPIFNGRDAKTCKLGRVGAMDLREDGINADYSRFEFRLKPRKTRKMRKVRKKPNSRDMIL